MKTDDDSSDDSYRESESATSTITADITAESNIWCLVIDSDHKPTFGEPFPVVVDQNSTIHELKLSIVPRNHPTGRFFRTLPSDIGIWRCKGLSAKYPLNRVKKLLSDFKFSDDEPEDSDVQQLGVAQKGSSFSEFLVDHWSADIYCTYCLRGKQETHFLTVTHLALGVLTAPVMGIQQM
ncbi:hypothetical protein EDB83DRAFT_2311278 [Lactarius deliciosus]|nr:hypothetical protein EDB83DRAFT_2311278 [Lactarius deliciosus]